MSIEETFANDEPPQNPLAQLQKDGFTGILVIAVPVLVNRVQAAAIFGKSPGWFDRYLAGEGKPLLKHTRQINHRRCFLTKAILAHIDVQRVS